MPTPPYAIVAHNFSPNEKLASVTMSTMALNINNHDHYSNGGAFLTIAALLAAGLMISNDGYAVYSP